MVLNTPSKFQKPKWNIIHRASDFITAERQSMMTSPRQLGDQTT
jgi:hypothetical protein